MSGYLSSMTILLNLKIDKKKFGDGPTIRPPPRKEVKKERR
jgi:hypothetical protein